MADTQITPELIAFIEKNHLDPANHFATAIVLMKQQEQIDEIAKNTIWYSEENKNGEITLFDKWNK